MRQGLRHRFERTAMYRTGSMRRELLQVFFRPVSFMRQEVVLGIEPMIFGHETITRDFRYD